MVGELIAGRYELEELVGSGGMSSVFRAYDRLLERRVALKVLHEQYTRDGDYVERFRREARAVARLGHANIVTVIDRGEQDGRQFIVFEYLEGENLKQLLRRTGPLPTRRALELASQIADALSFAHGHGIVHRDVKPQNVLLNGDEQAKVTDFGIARSVDVQQGLTQTGTVLGTSDYIAPEQARGRQVDAQSDVYSLAAVLYELLTGEVPFPGENFVAVALRHINEPVPSVLGRRPDVPLRLEAALQRAMAKDPAERFSSMDAFRAELEACLAGLGAEADADPTMIVTRPALRAGDERRARARRRVRPALFTALGVLALAGAVAGFLLVRGVPGRGSPAGAPASSTALHLAAVGAFDPNGDGREHDEDAPKATDGNPGTYWTTEHYRSFAKPGVGLVLDAGRQVALPTITLTTDTPGFTAEIRAGDLAEGPFRPVSESRTTATSTAFELDGAAAARYYVVWITKLAGAAHVNEATSG